MTTPTDNTNPDSRINLAGQLLLAMPGRVGGPFEHTVIYMCEHTEDGALGLVINRPTDLMLGDLLERLKLPLALEIGPEQDLPVYFGGPVQTDRGFVLHAPGAQYSSSISLGDLALTTSRDVLQDVAQGKGPGKLLVTLGYAGWSSGQLEQEMAENAWLNVQANDEILFNLPFAQRYDAALAQLGIDPLMLAGDIGHA